MLYRFSLPQEIYCRRLEVVNGIPFTCREMEIIAYILNGRGEKKIGAFLSMDERAVSSHTSNIRRKLGGGSRETIIDFIEKTDKAAVIKNEYYQSLNTRLFFENELKKARFFPNPSVEPVCFIVEWKEQSAQGTDTRKLKKYVKEQLIKHLEMMPIPIGKTPKKEYEHLGHLKHDLGTELHAYHVISIVSPSQLAQLLTQGNIQEPTACFPITFIVLDEGGDFLMPDEAKDADQIHIFSVKDYYLSVLSVVEKLSPSSNLHTFREKLDKQGKEGGGSFEPLEEENSYATAVYPGIIPTLVCFLKNKRKWVLSLVALILGAYGSYYWPFLENAGETFLANKNQKAYPIRGSLIIPPDTALLARPDIVAQIEDKFRQQKAGIQTVVLIGVGGSGKTILARQYASRYQHAPLIWEINAETKESLIDSFINLMGVITQKEGNKEIGKELKGIKNPKEKEEKIFEFIKGYLKSQPNWFLIFDNVEKFSTIEGYFPSDPSVWGEGKVILTTQNEHIQNNHNQRWPPKFGQCVKL